MKRREFITLLGSAAATWPLAARAQQSERMRRIGVFMNFAADDPVGQARLLAFAQALAQSGWTDGRNVRIDIRWGAGDPERIRKYAAELVARAPDVILASGGTTLGPLRQVSRTVPTVFTGVGDPVVKCMPQAREHFLDVQRHIRRTSALLACAPPARLQSGRPKALETVTRTRSPGPYSFTSPALRERLHRRLTALDMAVGRPAVLGMAEGEAAEPRILGRRARGLVNAADDCAVAEHVVIIVAPLA
jgi:hypothetical protein